MVLFKIRKRSVSTYVRDCKLWAKEAAKCHGFLGYRTLFRTNEKDQYASFYSWTKERFHTQFMRKNHDRLVRLSKCPVKVLGYFNFKTSPS